MNSHRHHLTRRKFLRASALTGIALHFSSRVLAAGNTLQPNILFIFGDQWRRQALGLYKGNTDYNMGDPVQTPHIDALAKEGVVYDNSYACAPVCCPNRATLVTGKYPANHGLTENKYADNFTYDERTIAHILADRGYDTAYIGKWHLANHHKNKNTYLTEEQRRGFQYWYGNEMCHHHFDGIHCHAPDEKDSLHGGKLPDLFTPSVHYSKKNQQKEKWMPEHMTRKAVEYLRNAYGRRATEKPFLCYLSYSPPHTIHGPVPLEGEEESYSIAGKQMTKVNGRQRPVFYGKSGRLKGIEYTVTPYSKAAPNEYRAPNSYEARYRAGGAHDAPPIDMGKRPNVSDRYYRHSITAHPGYYGAVDSLDDCIGRVLETLRSTEDPRNPGHKLIDNTLVVITSDHGELLGAHDSMGKGGLWEESVGVPLVIYWKGRTGAGIHKKTIFNSVDMVPTLLGALGIPKPHGVDGADLSADLLSRDAGNHEGYAFLRLYRWAAVRHRHYVYAFDRRISRECVLFDLEKDPFQMNPIAGSEATEPAHRQMISHLHEKLKAHLAGTKDALVLPG
ncbi:MAG: sulfatase-like hydrolase/transferase [Lentisphaerae bacterium]|jgi:arylsulfatase A-like enzyme|nr:sulfatase-like hydrolase/transferase [Lentisphaerota bacterium]MBT4823264.1 sulfatase-like hydrolase/transferase [Lentisphaerota bacterium]MBT5609172.1 sulfatase-like hydrolase/transferase [Lentisphaerota bacterium]MBT7053624.1 sulfatase-like hydrolase/transferase [Lentisphaerota bacterium]MBT7845717.1 sulfatase-like hydrolase/transferase [Lentisphaerota bacterium]